MTTGNRSRSSLAGRLLSDFGVLPDTETTANTTKIQDALIKCAGNYPLIIPPGNWISTTGDLEVYDDTHITGYGKLSKLKFATSIATGPACLVNEDLNNGNDNITLENFAIYGLGDGTPNVGGANSNSLIVFKRLNNCHIRNMFLTRASGVCVAFQGGTNLNFHDNDIFECGRDGIMTAWQTGTVMHDIRIHHNRFYMLGDDAISVQGHDGVGVQNGASATVSTTAGSPNVVGTGTNFQAGDVGKRISIENGGTGGVIPFESVITVVTDTTHITLRDNVTSNTATKKAIYGFNRPYNFEIDHNIIVSAVADDAGGSGGGVFCRGVEHGVISNNIINSTYYTGVSLAYMESGDYNNLVWCRNIDVIGNKVGNVGVYTGVGANLSDGLNLIGARNIRWADNTVWNIADTAYNKGTNLYENVTESNNIDLGAF